MIFERNLFIVTLLKEGQNKSKQILLYPYDFELVLMIWIFKPDANKMNRLPLKHQNIQM